MYKYFNLAQLLPFLKHANLVAHPYPHPHYSKSGKMARSVIVQVETKTCEIHFQG